MEAIIHNIEWIRDGKKTCIISFRSEQNAYALTLKVGQEVKIIPSDIDGVHIKQLTLEEDNG